VAAPEQGDQPDEEDVRPVAKMTEIREKYKDDPQKMNTETMNLTVSMA